METYSDAIFENYSALVLCKHWDGDQLHLLDVLRHEECRETLRDAIENGFTNEAFYWVVENEFRDGFYPLPLIFQTEADTPEDWKSRVRAAIVAILEDRA